MLLRLPLQSCLRAGTRTCTSRLEKGVSPSPFSCRECVQLASHLNARHRSAKSASKRASYFAALWLLDAQRLQNGRDPISRAVVSFSSTLNPKPTLNPT